jgi:hypothetical protein
MHGLGTLKCGNKRIAFTYTQCTFVVEQLGLNLRRLLRIYKTGSDTSSWWLPLLGILWGVNLGLEKKNEKCGNDGKVSKSDNLYWFQTELNPKCY